MWNWRSFIIGFTALSFSSPLPPYGHGQPKQQQIHQKQPMLVKKKRKPFPNSPSMGGFWTIKIWLVYDIISFTR